MPRRRQQPEPFPLFDPPVSVSESISQALPAKITSGLTGGPANAQGVVYQLDYTVYQACKLLHEALIAPHHDLHITPEPRAIHDDTVTRWDLSVATKRSLTEVKTNPSRNDIQDWLRRTREATDGRNGSKWELVYAIEAGTITSSLRSLIRLSNETGDDSKRFRNLALREHVADFDFITQVLGNNAANILRGMDIIHLPKHGLTFEV